MSTNKSFSTETSERYSRALFEVAKEYVEIDKMENTIVKSEPVVENTEKPKPKRKKKT